MSHLWHRTLRQWVAIAFVALFVLGMGVLWPFLGPLSLALLLAYILIPVVNRLARRMRWPRTAAAVCVYLLLIVVIILIPVLILPVIVNQVEVLIPTLIDGMEQLGTQIADLPTTTIFGLSINPYELYLEFSSPLVSVATNLASESFNVMFGIATTFVSTLVWSLFILVVSFYIVNDAPNISRYFWGLIPHEARQEVYYLTRRIDRTWHAFLRGQLMLATVIFVVTTLTLIILGVPQAFFLGVLAGLLNMVPNLGPVLSSVPAIAIALIQGSTQFEISNLLFGLIVTFAYVLIQQVESQWLTPRIIGGSVNLHPAMIIIGAIIGFSAVGVFGIFLAAPTLASLRIVGGYAYRKMLSPDYKPPHIDLPLEIAALPDPGQRPMKPFLSSTDTVEEVPLWQQWLTRSLPPVPPTPSEDSPDA